MLCMVSRLVPAGLAVLGAALLLLPSSISTTTLCDASGACLTDESWGSPSLIALVGSLVFAALIYVFTASRLRLRATPQR